MTGVAPDDWGVFLYAGEFQDFVKIYHRLLQLSSCSGKVSFMLSSPFFLRKRVRFKK